MIVDWLTSTDYATQQSDFIARRQQGTGLWLLNSAEFRLWVKHAKKTLFCPGIPGSGKTMITSIVVEHLWTEFRNDPSVSIAYLYCNFRSQQEQKPIDLLSSLLKQLVQERPFTSENIKSLYECHREKRTRPSLEEISKALHSAVMDYSRTFIIVDALDECQASDGSRRKFLSEIFNLQAETGVNFFATSRFIPGIEKEFEGAASQEIRASGEDLEIYLDAHISRLSSCVFRSRMLPDTIKAEIIKAADGMFLLAQLHLDSLIDKTTPKAIRIALQNLPKGSGALDCAYQEAMERVESQKPGFHKLAKQVLSWITCAKRPLTTLEVQHALAVEIGASELDEENLPEIEEMVSVCAGLVTVNEESNIIRLVHYTTQEYFERKQKIWFPTAEADITRICVAYLAFDAFEDGFCQTNTQFKARLASNPLYDYASRYWGHHAQAASIEVEELVLNFLQSDAKVCACSQALMASKYYGNNSQGAPNRMTGVHLTALLGLMGTTVVLLSNGNSPSVEDAHRRTPLSYAAEYGNEAVVKLLLGVSDVDPDSKCKSERTPLSWAAEKGHEAVVKLLLVRDGVNPDSEDIMGRTPLSWAAES
ncbi:uncharacterized protein BDR25DRAFT_265562, partial [Lindgomyces ingoldianus]